MRVMGASSIVYPLAQGAAMREPRLLAGDELEQRRLAALRGFPRAAEGGRDVLRPLHALAPAAHGAPEVRVASTDVARAVLVVRHHEVRDLDGHGRVVEHHREDGN